MKQLQHGLLIAIEGIDGSGKSTLALNIAKALTFQSWPVVLTKEPGDTPLGSHICSLIHDCSIPKTALAEFLLFAADRAQHMSTIVLPALEQNKIVISDRMADSSLVYQGYVRGVDQNMITLINRWVMQGREPDIILYPRVSAEVAYHRLMARKSPLTHFELELEISRQLVAGFDLLMESKPHAFILDGSQKPEQVSDCTMEIILSWIQKNKLAL